MLTAQRTVRIPFDPDFSEVRLSGVEIQQTIGQWTADAQDQKLASGTIALQQGGRGEFGLVRFRNVKVRPL